MHEDRRSYSNRDRKIVRALCSSTERVRPRLEAPLPLVTRDAELVPTLRLAQAMGYVGLAALVTNAWSPLVAEPLATHRGLVRGISLGCRLRLSSSGGRNAPRRRAPQRPNAALVHRRGVGDAHRRICALTDLMS
jgi:hypothetical protein